MRETREVMKPRHETVTTTCDACDKRGQGEPDGWFHFQWGHGDWGNDSVESGGTADACSGECLFKLLRGVLDDYEPGTVGGAPGVPVRENPTLWLSLDSLDHYALKSLVSGPFRDEE